MEKRVYRRNKTKGTRKGSKWPEDVKTAALCDLLTNNNICDVARRYGVPESTLRTWLTAARKKGPTETKSLFDQAREKEIQALNHHAAAGARLSIEYIRRRLEVNDADAEIYAQARAALDDPETPEEERSRLLQLMDRHRPMSDFAATNYLRTLTGTVAKTGAILGDKEEAGGITVQLSEELQELAR